MGGEDLIAFELPLQCGTKTLDLTGTSDVLQKFDQDTRLVASVVLSVVLVAAAVLACEELTPTKSASLNATGSVGATDQVQGTQLTSSSTPETAYRPVETPAPNPSSARALTSQSNPVDAQITTSQRSSQPVQEVAEPKSKSPRHRTSIAP